MRSDVTKSNIAGFVEQNVYNGTKQLVDLKVAFGPIFEEYSRENTFLADMDVVFGDQQRDVYKYSGKDIRDNSGDFSPTAMLAGVSATPETVSIKVTTVKEYATKFYETDWKQSNGLETMTQRFVNEVMIAPDEAIDLDVVAELEKSATANTELPAIALDIDAMAVNAENGKKVFESISDFVFKFKATAKTNTYARNKVFRDSEVKITISPKVEALLTAYKSGFIDQSGLLNTGVFGTAFRNISMRTALNMSDTFHVFIRTPRAIMGTLEGTRHMKYIPAELNQTGYETKANHVVGWGFKEVFANEVAGIKQGSSKSAKKTTEA